jgi:hypothetical protein
MSPDTHTNTEDQNKTREHVLVVPISRLFRKGDFHDSGTRLSIRSYAEDPLSGLPPWPPQPSR